MNLAAIHQITAHGRPFFLYDSERLRSAALLRREWKEKFRGGLFVSVKSNPNPHLLRELKDIADGFDVSSLNELHAAGLAGMPADRCSFSGPAKDASVFSQKVAVYHLDSVEEWERFKGIGKCTLRLATGPGMKLGFERTEAEALLKKAPAGSLQGFHCYLGRDAFDVKRLELFFQAADSLRAAFPSAFSDFQLYTGAGFPAGSAGIKSGLDSVAAPAFPVHLEAGRAVFAECGTYGARVLSVKRREGRAVVIVDGGIQHLSGWASPKTGFSGLTVSAIREGKLLAGGMESAVYGSLCLGNDILHPGAKLPPDLVAGDWLLFPRAGAYGITAGPSQFIGQVFPGEWLADAGKLREISASPPFSYHRAFEGAL